MGEIKRPHLDLRPLEENFLTSGAGESFGRVAVLLMVGLHVQLLVLPPREPLLAHGALESFPLFPATQRRLIIVFELVEVVKCNYNNKIYF